MIKWIASVALWLLFNVLPDRFVLWLLDVFLPGWERAAEQAMKNVHR